MPWQAVLSVSCQFQEHVVVSGLCGPPARGTLRQGREVGGCWSFSRHWRVPPLGFLSSLGWLHPGLYRLGIKSESAGVNRWLQQDSLFPFGNCRYQAGNPPVCVENPILGVLQRFTSPINYSLLLNLPWGQGAYFQHLV